MFGETAGIKIALNSNKPSASLTGWQTATVPMNSNSSSYLAGQQTRQFPDVTTRHDRNFGWHFARLPYGYGSVPLGQDNQPHG